MRRFLALLLTALLLIAGCQRPTTAEPASPMRFAFVRGGDLWLWQDGEERRLTTGAPVRFPRFSPTGRYIAYWQENRLMVTSAEGGGPWPVPDVALTSFSPSIDWHPYDDRLAVVRTLGTQRSVWVYRITPDAGPEQEGLTVEGWDHPHWRPDGRYLTISRRESSPANPHVGTAYVATISPADGEPALLLADPFEPGTGGDRCGTGALPLAWSADGDYLLLVRPGWTSSIAADCNEWLVLDPATGQTAQPGASPNTQWAAWSPAEPVLAYVHGPDRVAFAGKELRLIAPPWERSRRLTPPGYADREPAWSPSGHSLAFTRGRSEVPRRMDQPAEGQAIYLVDVESSKTRRVAGSDGGFGPFWGDDGTLFWFTTGPVAVPPGETPAKASLRHARADLPSPLLTLDQPPLYYGQWAWRQVLDAWIPARPHVRP